MNTIDNQYFKNQKAIIRVDFNVPLDGSFNITDPTRINAALPTIKKILNDDGSVILMSHLGRPKDGPEEKFSLKHLVPYLSEVLSREVKFADDCIGESAKTLAKNLNPGEVLLLENLRFYKEETKGDRDFASKLASLADMYVNDAFGTAHRAHASTTIVAEFFPQAKFFGYLLAQEVANLNKVMKDPQKPFTAVLGGAKISGKIEVINNLIDKVDNLIIGGGMMFTFIKATGGNIGNSLVEDDLLDTALEAIEKAKMKGVKVYLPIDTIAANKFDNDAEIKNTASDNVPDEWLGLDIGPLSRTQFSSIIEGSSTVLWNGPMGVFEMSRFAEGTREVAEAVARATERGAYTLIGGGDSVAAINKYHLADKVSYVSTGGGAMLEYIEGKELPGVKALMG